MGHVKGSIPSIAHRAPSPSLERHGSIPTSPKSPWRLAFHQADRSLFWVLLFFFFFSKAMFEKVRNSAAQVDRVASTVCTIYTERVLIQLNPRNPNAAKQTIQIHLHTDQDLFPSHEHNQRQMMSGNPARPLLCRRPQYPVDANETVQFRLTRSYQFTPSGCWESRGQ